MGISAAAGLTMALLPIGAAGASARPEQAPRASAGVNWGACPNGWGFPVGDLPPEDPMSQVKFSCGTVDVPMDYDNPSGSKIPIAMRRIEATDPAHRIGTIFLNPGGPGGSGVDFTDAAWALYGPQIREKFDIVGFDPRGIARSKGLSCFNSFQQARRVFSMAEPFPLNRAEHEDIVQSNSRLVQLCEKKGQEIRNHLSTANVARDLDQLRQAVGDDRLNYIGYSYGTQIGNTYAAMFPQRIRSMVIDAVVDPVKWTTGARGEGRRVPMTTRLGSADSAQATLEQFFALCRQAGAQNCPLSRQGDPAEIYRKLVDLTRKEPIRVDLGGYIMELTYQDLVGGTLSSLYNPASWSDLASVLSLAADQSGVAKLPAAGRVAARKNVRAFAGAPMPTIGEGAFGVICEDSDNPKDPGAWWDASQRSARRSYFGPPWTYLSAQCAQWSMKDADRYMGPFTTTPAKPVLIVGNLYDPATPYAGAQAANRNIRGSRLLTVATWGHTAVGGVSKCADAAVEQYLVNGTLPAAGTTCQPDNLPFSTPAEILAQQATPAARAQMKVKLAAQRYITQAALGGKGWSALRR